MTPRTNQNTALCKLSNQNAALHPPAGFSPSHQWRLELGCQLCGFHGNASVSRPGGGGAAAAPRRGVGVSAWQDGGRSQVVPAGDGGVELTGQRRRRNWKRDTVEDNEPEDSAPSGGQRNCSRCYLRVLLRAGTAWPASPPSPLLPHAVGSGVSSGTLGGTAGRWRRPRPPPSGSGGR